MKRSCFFAVFLSLAVWGAAGASALDTPPAAAPTSKTSHKTTTHHVRRRVRTTAAHRTTRTTVHKTTVHKTIVHKTTRTTTSRVRRTRTTVKRTTRAHVRRTVLRRHRYYERFTANPYLSGTVGAGDVTAGEDPVVRQAAVDALGDLNGTVVVIDPTNGRILTMVNQQIALSPGAEPCSTIKLSVALAALSEGLVTRDTMVRLPGFRMNMTQALAHSNNLYFEELGRELGFERVHRYAKEFGLGELAGYHIAGEQLGEYPDHPIPVSQGGVGRMCSFGQGVSMTPLQLGAVVMTIANGGTLYYLQHPTTPEQVAEFKPMIKRKLDIARDIPEMIDGMAGSVQYGTARSLRVSFDQIPVFGKTGTCSNEGTRFGWFASFLKSPQRNLVAVFFFKGRHGTSGPHSAEIAGHFYRDLWDQDYFAVKMQQAQEAPAGGVGGSGASQ